MTLHLAVGTLAAQPGAVPRTLGPELVVDALWAVAVPADQVEHISAVSKSGLTSVGLYLRAVNQAEADLAARTLIGRAARTVPLLSGWRLQAPETPWSAGCPLSWIAGLAKAEDAVWPPPGPVDGVAQDAP